MFHVDGISVLSPCGAGEEGADIMKKLLVSIIALVVVSTLVAPMQARAEEAAATEAVTQAELARILTNVLGLSRFLPSQPTSAQRIAVLMENGIEPEGGWQPDAPVTRADLARLVVLAMDRRHEVEDPDDPRSWIALLAELGVSLESIGAATASIEPSAEPVAPHVFRTTATADPMARERTGMPDEREFGTDASMEVTSRPVTPEQVRIAIIEAEFPPFEPDPITPD